MVDSTILGENGTQLTDLLNECIKFKSPSIDIDLILSKITCIELNRPNKKGLYPIFYAVYEDDINLVEKLLLKGAKVNVRDFNGFSPLHIACKEGYYDICNILLKNNAEVNGPDWKSLKTSSYLTSPLNMALQNNRPNIVRLLLEFGADPNLEHFLGSEIHRFPLKYVECLKLLLDFGSNANTFNRAGQPLIIKACLENSFEAVELLLKSGNVDVNAIESISNFTALHCAIICDNKKLAELLLSFGAKLNPANCSVSALDLCITRTKIDILELLLTKIDNINAYNVEGVTPLQLSVAQPSFTPQEFVRLFDCLLKKGADPRISGLKYKYFLPSFTPLLEYFTYQNAYDVKAVHLLIKYGASVKISLPTRYLKPKMSDGLLNQMHKLNVLTTTEELRQNNIINYDIMTTESNDNKIFNLLLNAADTFETAAIKRSKKLSPEIIDILLKAASECRNLKTIAVNKIRFCLKSPLPISIDILPLPSILKNCLLYEPFEDYI